VVELIDLASVLVTVDAPETAYPFVRVGDEVAVQLDAIGEQLTGRVKHIVPQADEAARTFPVEIEIENSEAKLIGGMLAWAAVRSGPDQPVVAVPKDAVDVRQGTPYVCIVRPTEQGPIAMPTPVTTGADVEEYVAITSGNVPPEAIVVTRGNERIFFPSPVMVTNMSLPGAPPTTGSPAAGAGPQGESKS
jgi:multidrug efflux pump subunit AcrA (membrane-fusion protein)